MFLPLLRKKHNKKVGHPGAKGHFQSRALLENFVVKEGSKKINKHVIAFDAGVKVAVINDILEKYNIRYRNRSENSTGMQKAKGKFRTRHELEKAVVSKYKETRNMALTARECGVGAITARTIVIEHGLKLNHTKGRPRDNYEKVKRNVNKSATVS